MQRRRLLQIGIASGAVLAIAGTGAALWRPGWRETRLSDAGRRVFRAVARAVLDGSLPSNRAEQATALEAHLIRLDATVNAFPPATQTEISQLLALLHAPPSRLMLAGLTVSWDDATISELQVALQSMRMSSLTLRQQAYHALRDLTNAAWYADPATWPALGYPGPRTL